MAFPVGLRFRLYIYILPIFSCSTMPRIASTGVPLSSISRFSYITSSRTMTSCGSNNRFVLVQSIYILLFDIVIIEVIDGCVDLSFIEHVEYDHRRLVYVFDINETVCDRFRLVRGLLAARRTRVIPDNRGVGISLVDCL